MQLFFFFTSFFSFPFSFSLDGEGVEVSGFFLGVDEEVNILSLQTLFFMFCLQGEFFDEKRSNKYVYYKKIEEGTRRTDDGYVIGDLTLQGR